MGRKLLSFLILAAFGLAVLLLFQRDFDAGLFFESFTEVRPVWLLLSTMLTFLGYALRALRWQELLMSMQLISIRTLFSTTILGFSVIYLLGRAGEFARPLWLSKQEDVNVAGAFATIIIERVFDTLMLLLLFALTVGTLQGEIGTSNLINLLTRSAWFLLGASSVVLLLFILFRTNFESVASCIPYKKLSSAVEGFALGLSITASWQKLTLTTAYSLLLWLGIALQFWMMLFGLNIELTFQAATFVLVGSALGSIIQLPAIGGGFQAGFVFCLTTFFLVPVETAIAASVIAWFFSYVPTIAVAGIYIIWEGISAKELVTPERA